MIIDSGSDRPIISYPCDWTYTVIVKDPVMIEQTIEKILGKYNYNIVPSNASKKGKYYSFRVVVNVPDEETKDMLFQQLEAEETISIVL
jgi:putative lipoic acid-binding regulatory protein